MPPDLSPAASRLLAILDTEARGRNQPMPVRSLALRLGLSGRDVQTLAVELVKEGHLIGSSCTPGHAGLFLFETRQDLEEGTRHIRSRALFSLRRVSLLRKAAEQRFGPEALQLFDLDREAS